MNQCVYFLRCPSTMEIRYVGKGNPKRPYALSPSRRHGRCKNWIINLSKKGLKPVVEVVFENLSYNDASEIECTYIDAFKKSGRLTNLTIGGDGSKGYKHSDHIKEQLSIMKKGKPLSRETVEGFLKFKEENPKFSTIKKGSKLSESHIQALINSKKGKNYKKVSYENARKVPCRCIDKLTGEITIFPTLRACADAIGVKWSLVTNHVRRNSSLLNKRFNVRPLKA